MANGGRDLTFNFLSKMDRFDLTKPAAGFEKLADSAGDAGDQLEQLDRADPGLDKIERDAKDAGDALDHAADDARRTGDALDQIGTDAKAAAAKYDDAADAIARASKRAGDAADDGADRAKQGLDEFKGEAGSTGREAAASFSGGFDDITDALQETAANAFAGFGPAGAAAGIAAAAGLGFVMAKIEETKARVKALREAFVDAASDGADTLAERVEAVMDQLVENDQLSQFAELTRKAGISWGDFTKALAGDPAAIARVTSEIDAWETANRSWFDTATGVNSGMDNLRDALGETKEAQTGATEQTRLHAEALQGMQAAEEAAAQLEALTDALDGFTEPATTYTDLLAAKNEKERETAQATADATKSQSDSWEDYVKAADVSVNEYLTTLEKQVAAQEQWATNLETLARKGVEQGVIEQLARLGPEGAPLVAKLTTASDAELQRLVALYGRAGAAGVAGLATNINAGKPAAVAAGTNVWQGVRDAAGNPITIPTKVGTPPTGGPFGIFGIISAVQAAARANPVVVPVMLSKVPTSIWAVPKVTP